MKGVQLAGEGVTVRELYALSRVYGLTRFTFKDLIVFGDRSIRVGCGKSAGQVITNLKKKGLIKVVSLKYLPSTSGPGLYKVTEEGVKTYEKNKELLKWRRVGEKIPDNVMWLNKDDEILFHIEKRGQRNYYVRLASMKNEKAVIGLGTVWSWKEAVELVKYYILRKSGDWARAVENLAKRRIAYPEYEGQMTGSLYYPYVRGKIKNDV